MSEVILKYAAFFKAMQVFNSKPVETRRTICTPFFNGVLHGVTDSTVRNRMHNYSEREQQRLNSMGDREAS
jgi:hypothetical protein